MTNLPQLLLIQVGLILLNAFFAATEIAVISLNTAKLRKLQEAGDKAAGKLLKMAEAPTGFLSTIQIGITLAGFLGSAFAAENFSDSLADWIYKDLGIHVLPPAAVDTVAVILITLVLSYFTLIFGELVPKRIAMQKSFAVAKFSCGVISAIAFLMRPIIAFLSLSTNVVLRLLGMSTQAEEEDVTEEDIRMMIDLGKERGTIEAEENEWIQNVFDFGDSSILSAMTRDADMDVLYETSTEEEILKTIRETGRSRFPVYTEDHEDIKGILYAREFLMNLTEEKKKSLDELLHPAYFVPESIHADVLFRDMQTKKFHMAIVVDEYGNLSGLITMEDLLEEIVGNIYDEFDTEVDPEIEKVSDDTWRFPGDTPLEDVEETLGCSLSDEEDCDTIGGLILSCLHTIPSDGTTVDVKTHGLALHAEQIEGRRITSVLVKKLPPQEQPEQKNQDEEGKKAEGQ